MKNLFLDLWNDLREKRLWPVAVVLLLGLVAVPVVLSKSATPAPAPTPSASAPKASVAKELKQLTAVKLDESAVDESSPLNTFDPANPFRPPSAVVKRSNDDGEPATTTGSPTDTGSTGDTGTGDTGGTTGTTPTTPTGPGTTTTVEYEWVVDATFGANGNARRIKTLEKLDMLPGERKPLLIFLGATAGGGSAVFLVDSTLKSAGEGTCKPSNSQCAFVYLGSGSEQQFTNDQGDAYTLHINEIRRVKIDPKAAKKASKAARQAKPRAGAAVGTLKHRFVPNLLSDLVSVSTTAGATSTPDSDGR